MKVGVGVNVGAGVEVGVAVTTTIWVTMMRCGVAVGKAYSVARTASPIKRGSGRGGVWMRHKSASSVSRMPTSRNRVFRATPSYNRAIRAVRRKVAVAMAKIMALMIHNTNPISATNQFDRMKAPAACPTTSNTIGKTIRLPI